MRLSTFEIELNWKVGSSYFILDCILSAFVFPPEHLFFFSFLPSRKTRIDRFAFTASAAVSDWTERLIEIALNEAQYDAK